MQKWESTFRVAGGSPRWRVAGYLSGIESVLRHRFSPLFLLCSVIILNEVCQVFGFGQNGGMSITPEEKQLNDAIALAADIHRNQVRKEPDGRPYICHVLDVVNAIPKEKHLERLVAALHDTVEDVAEEEKDLEVANQKREALRLEIGQKFSPEVLAGVEAMTHI